MFPQVLSVICLLHIWYSYWVVMTPPRPPAIQPSRVENQDLVRYIRKVSLVAKTIHSVFLSVEIYVCIRKGRAPDTALPFIGFGEWCSRFSDDIYPSGRISSLVFVAALCCTTGTMIRLLCYRTLGDLFTWEISVQKSHRLITTGLYSYVRHPSYTGLGLIYLGGSLFVLAPGTFFTECIAREHYTPGLFFKLYYVVYALTLSTWMFSRAPKEDRVLKKEFGEEWDRWAGQTPYLFVPFIL